MGVLSETNDGFALVCALIGRVERVKGKGYRASFMKRGESEIKANLDRKYDRLDNWEKLSPEDLLDTLGDLAVYAVKWVQYALDRLPPEAAQRYVKAIAEMEETSQ